MQIEAVFQTDGGAECQPVAEMPRGTDGWLAVLNRRMTEMVLPNEADLEALQGELEKGVARFPDAWWLTVARLFELALWYLGHAVDAGEFTAAGDLLVNPRRVNVYVRGEPMPRLKPRHQGLVEGVAGGGCRADAIGWLQRETCVRVARPALLPELFGRLRGADRFRSDYLDSGDRRMKHAASVMAFRWAAHGGAGRMIGEESAGGSRWSGVGRCGFTRDRFDEMGQELSRMASGSEFRSRFLRGTPH